MADITAQVDSLALATAASNALAHMPANSVVKLARMAVIPGYVVFTATDGYTAGLDSCEARGVTGGVTCLVDRPALQAIDAAGRSDRKGVAVLTVAPGEVRLSTQADQENPVVVARHDAEGADEWETYRLVDRLLAGGEPDTDTATAFQPTLLQRFAKVKADKAQRVADLLISDPEAPVLVKIGPTFRGLIMPVYREQHSENVGADGLW